MKLDLDPKKELILVLAGYAGLMWPFVRRILVCPWNLGKLGEVVGLAKRVMILSKSLTSHRDHKNLRLQRWLEVFVICLSVFWRRPAFRLLFLCGSCVFQAFSRSRSVDVFLFMRVGKRGEALAWPELGQCCFKVGWSLDVRGASSTTSSTWTRSPGTCRRARSNGLFPRQNVDPGAGNEGVAIGESLMVARTAPGLRPKTAGPEGDLEVSSCAAGAAATSLALNEGIRIGI